MDRESFIKKKLEAINDQIDLYRILNQFSSKKNIDINNKFNKNIEYESSSDKKYLSEEVAKEDTINAKNPLHADDKLGGYDDSVEYGIDNYLIFEMDDFK